MKKLLAKTALMAVMAVSAQQASAQVYGGVSLGYGFAATNDVLGTDATTNTAGQTTTTNVYGTYGGGLTAQLNVGYYFNPNFRFDLGAHYLAGSATMATRTTTPTSTSTRTVQTSQFRLQPTFVVQAAGEGKIQPFARFGALLPVGGSTKRTDELELPSANTTATAVTVLKGAPSVGFVGGAGVIYNLNENMMLTGELLYTGLRVKTKSAEVTENKSTTNGTEVDNLPNMTTFQKEFNFVDELTSSSNTLSNPNVDLNKAQDILATRVNFSALSIQIGFAYKFGASAE